MLEWWNFMFLLPLVSGLALALGVALVGAGFGGGEDGGAEASAGEELGGEQEASEDGGKGLLQFLSFFGFGRGLPLSVLLPILLVSWGIAGLLLNGLLSAFLAPLVFAPLSALLGFGLASLLGRALAGGFSRLFGGGETATRTGGLVGCVGTAVFTVKPDEGTANIRDPFGNIHRIACRVPEGEASIAPGGEVLVTAFEARDHVYYVAPLAASLAQDVARERSGTRAAAAMPKGEAS
jgi:hypothetical protein